MPVGAGACQNSTQNTASSTQNSATSTQNIATSTRNTATLAQNTAASTHPSISTPTSVPALDPGEAVTLDDEAKRMSRDLDAAAASAAREVATVDAMWERMRLDGTPLPHAQAPDELPSDVSGAAASMPAREAVRQERAAVRGRAVQSVRETQRMVADSLRKVRQLGLGEATVSQATADSAAGSRAAS
jgi:hypothetical protein